MARRPYRRLCVACGFVLFGLGLWAQTIRVMDAEGHSTSVTVAQIGNSPHVTVNVRDHDTPAQFDGMPLSTVLSIASIQLGENLRGPRMTEAA
jgi:hypothetical protein